MSLQRMPEAHLEDRASDVDLTNDQLLKLSAFAQLKRKPTLDKFPGALAVRYFEAKELIYRQGEPGWTAFYVLTTEDVRFLRECQLAETSDETERQIFRQDVQHLTQRAAALKQLPKNDARRTLATIYFAVAQDGESKRKPTNRMLASKKDSSHGAMRNRAGHTLYLPEMGPQTLSYDSFRAPLQEGETFGETGCLYRVPRSETVVANQGFYALEMLRNILEQIQRDPLNKAQLDETYKKRVMELHLRELPFFRDLSKEDFQELAQNVELRSYEAGELIYDEHEKADAIFVVRQGLVKECQGISWLIGAKEIVSWSELIGQLQRGSTDASSLEGVVWSLLTPEAQRLIQSNKDDADPSTTVRREIRHALNVVIRAPQLAKVDAMRALASTPAFNQATPDGAAKLEQWPGASVRKHNRRLLELIFPELISLRHVTAGLERVLNYRATGEHFGEMEVLLDESRITSWVAYGHPNEHGRVELVRISKDLFQRMLVKFPAVRASVEEAVKIRRKQLKQQLTSSIWGDGAVLRFSNRFEELGLIQGQRLMLIDLDHCTRCDECVRACVNVHDDGRSRLFLDGPRFDKYLIPTTCRSCLDPVCLIGCPVGSIHRGDNREIIVEDWCIGCGTCADACPYGSIQMHDLGIVPVAARGWRYLPATLVGEKPWHEPGHRDKDWLGGDAPFLLSRDFGDQLRRSIGADEYDARGQIVCFRRELTLDRDQVRDERQYQVEILAQGDPEKVHLWINGVELERTGKPRRGRHEYLIPPKESLELVPSVDGVLEWNLTMPKQAALRLSELFHAGRNVIAVQVAAPMTPYETVLQLRLDIVRKPKDLPENLDASVVEEITEKMVTHRAVVCDLCSSLSGGKLACVQACPHDAALRVDARHDQSFR